MLSWSESRKLPTIEFEDRIARAVCVGNGSYFYDEWDTRKDIRICNDGYAFRYAPRDYILVKWVGVSENESTLYYLAGDGAIEIVAPALKGYGGAVEAAVLGHCNPERLERLREERAAAAIAEEARKKYGQSHQRARLWTYEATIPVGTFFRTPSGYLGYMAGRGEVNVSWYAVTPSDMPDGVEIVDLPREMEATRIM
jgi:hypothetical protein